MQDETERPSGLRKSFIPSSLFTTEMLPPSERFDAWRESIGVVYDVRRPIGAPATFDASVESYLFDDVVLARCRAGAQKFDRSKQRLTSDAIDHYMLQLFLSGSVEMKNGRRSPAHSLVAFDFGETLDTFNTDFDLLSLVIPRRRLAPLLKRPDSIHEMQIDGERGTGRLIADYLRGLFAEAPRLRPGEAGAALRPLIDLIAIAINGSAPAADGRSDLVTQAALVRAQTFIRDNLHRFDLDPIQVAGYLGMSRAQLYRLFASAGGVADYIREQRLRRCLADLLSVQHAHRQISEIAFSWGFADPVHFAKAFRKRFGHSPSDARAMAAAEMRTGVRAADDRVGDRLYEAWLAGLA